MKTKAIISLALTLALTASALAQASQRSAKPASVAAGDTLIQNATILTASHGTIQNGSILIRNGKIAEVGKNLKPRDASVRVIDATGKYVMPGIIDCHSHTAV